MKKIILTGGGTAGHVTPNLALIPSLREAGYDIRYIGSYQGMDASLLKMQVFPMTAYPLVSCAGILTSRTFLTRSASSRVMEKRCVSSDVISQM